MINEKLPHHHKEGAKTRTIQEQLNNIDDFQTISEIFKQLGDPTICGHYATAA